MNKDDLIVTTARKQMSRLVGRAEEVARALGATCVHREDISVADMMTTYDANVLVIGKTRLTLHTKDGQEPFFYHPSSAMFRVKQLMKTGYDPLVEVAQLKEGMSFLDCTLGLASDSLVAKFAVGETGSVVGLEANELVAFLVRDGLMNWQEGTEELIRCMREIEVVYSHHLSYLNEQPSKSVDVVYFDPMFETHVDASTGIKGLKSVASHDDLVDEAITQAKRVARNRVILKDHWQSSRFEQFGFQRIKRQHAAFHYGYIEV